MYYVVEVWLGSTKTVTPIPFKEGEIMRMFVIMSVMVLFGLGISPLSSQQEGEGFVISRQMLLWDVWSETPEIQGEYGVNNWEHFRNETSRVNSMEEGDLPWRKVITGQFVILPPRAVRAMAAGRAQEQQEVASTISDELATLQARIAELEQELAQAAEPAREPWLSSNANVALGILILFLLGISGGLYRSKQALRKQLVDMTSKVEVFSAIGVENLKMLVRFADKNGQLVELPEGIVRADGTDGPELFVKTDVNGEDAVFAIDGRKVLLKNIARHLYSVPEEALRARGLARVSGTRAIAS